LEITERVDLEPGEDREETEKEIRKRRFTAIDEATMRGIVHIANQEVR